MSRFTSAFAPKLEAMLEYRIARGLKEESHTIPCIMLHRVRKVGV